MDNSGSMGRTNFYLQRDFVSSMVTNSISSDSRVGIYKFGKRNRNVWPLDKYQTDRVAMASKISSTRYNGDSATHIAEAALKAAEEFSLMQTPNPRLLFILTDGNPSPSSNNPCQIQSGDYLSALDILKAMSPYVQRFIIGMGNSWTPSIIDCFVDDPATQVIEVTDWTAEAFSQLQLITESITCPESWDVILTEVRIEPLANTVSYISQFIEFYVKSSVRLNASSLAFGGLVTTQTVFGNCNIYLPTNSYVVIYNPDINANAMECVGCQCGTGALNGDTFLCDNAIFIACGSVGECGKCDWSTSYTNQNWRQNISDADSQSLVSSAEYTNAFPGIVTGWSYELIEIPAGTTSAANWQQSCNYTGTPGAPPLAICTVTCVDTACKVNGDTSATCNPVTDTCVCNSVAHYFQQGLTCMFLGPPTDCRIVPELVNNTFSSTVGSWTAPVTSASPSYKWTIDYFDAGGTTFYRYFYYSKQILEEHPVTVQAIVTMPSGAKIYSTVHNCAIITMAPTLSPTPQPTSSIPPIANCTATVGELATIIVWATADTSAGTGPESIIYYIFGKYDKTSLAPENNIAKESSTTSISLPMSDPLKLEVSVVVMVYDNAGAPDTSRMSGSASIAVCGIETSAPTMKPSAGSTLTPTASPSGHPTARPTSNPTFRGWTVDSCVVSIPGGPAARQVSFSAAYTAGGSSSAIVRLYINSAVQNYFIGAIFATANAVSKEIGFAFVPDGTANYSVRLTYDQYPDDDSIKIVTEAVFCSVITVSPTASPTRTPSTPPTRIPTSSPTYKPSDAPTGDPTPSPSFAQLVIPDECAYSLDSSNIITLTFREATYSLTVGGDLPTGGDFEYLFKYNADRNSRRIGPRASGDVQTIRQLTFDGVFDPTTATLRIKTLLVGQNSMVFCALTTITPTLSPTTGAPTLNPTLRSLSVYLDITENWGFSERCIPSTDTRAAIVSESEDNYGSDFVQCKITEDSEKRSIVFSREPTKWPFDVLVTFKIIYVKMSFTRGVHMTARDFDARSHPAFLSGKESTFVFLANEDKFRISYALTVDEIDEEYDFFVVKFVSCVNNNSQVGYPHDYMCNKESIEDADEGKLFNVRIQVISEANDAFSVITLGDLPVWIWYAIGAAFISVPIIIYLIWRFRNQRKAAEILEAQKKNELVEAENMDDVGNFGEVGDNVVANPLATGGTFDIVKQDEVIQHELDVEIMNFEIATVEVENNWFKQDFGPVMAEMHEIENSADFDDTRNISGIGEF